MYISESPRDKLNRLLESGFIKKPEDNLRSKIASIVRALQNLETKKERIDYEIRKQKQSLARKRNELVKNSKHITAKKKSLRESQEDSSKFFDSDLEFLTKTDAKLLQESAQILDRA